MLLHFKMSRKGRQNISPLRSLRSDEEFPFLIPPIALARGTTNLTHYRDRAGAARFSTTSFQDIFLPVSGEGNR